MSDVDFRIVDTAELADEAAASLIAEAAGSGGHIGLSGGSGPRQAYERTGILRPDWRRVDLWWVDDRVVPPADALSNYRLVRESLLDGLSHEPTVHRVPTESGPERAADEYDRALAGVALDLAVMGIGADGHTASLFPNAPTLEVADRRAITAEAGMEPFVPRVTMTRTMLSFSKVMVYLVTGEGKARAVTRAFVDEPSPETPASLIRGQQTVAILDRAAASMLTPGSDPEGV